MFAPVMHILRGLQFDSSSSDADSFYVWSFILSLFVPTEFVHGSLGNRLRLRSGADRWNRKNNDFMSQLNDAVQKDALPVLMRADTVPGAIEVLQEQLDRSGGKAGSTREALAYCLAFTGRYDQSNEHLKLIAGSLDRSIAWQKEKAERAELLMAKIAQGPEAVQAQLNEWRAQTVHNLGFSELLSPTTMGAA